MDDDSEFDAVLQAEKSKVAGEKEWSRQIRWNIF